MIHVPYLLKARNSGNGHGVGDGSCYRITQKNACTGFGVPVGAAQVRQCHSGCPICICKTGNGHSHPVNVDDRYVSHRQLCIGLRARGHCKTLKAHIVWTLCFD